MKLVHPEIVQIIDFQCGCVNELIIENQQFFRAFIEDINLGIAGFSSKIQLSLKDKPVDLSKYALVITEYAPLQLNKKTLITKIIQSLEKEALNESNYVETMEIIAQIERYLLGLTLSLPCEIEFGKISIGVLIKAMSPEIVESGKTTIEKLFDFMELVRELEKDKVYVLVNIRSYISDDEMESFLSTALSHDHKILLVESQARNKLAMTKRLIIDKDLCEI